MAKKKVTKKQTKKPVAKKTEIKKEIVKEEKVTKKEVEKEKTPKKKKTLKNNKKVIYGVAIGIIVVGFALLIALFTVKGYNEISYKEFKNKLESKESFVLVVGKKDCSYCDDYKTTLKLVAKDTNFKVDYIDISKFSEEESSDFKSIVSIDGTPTTVFFKNGSETTSYDRLGGAVSAKKLINKLEKLGFIE